MRRVRTALLVACILTTTMALVVAPAGASDRFGDVPDSDIFHDDIGWLAEEGITRGCNPPGNDRFCPDEPVTRGEMAAFFSRALGLTATTGGTDFRDTDDSVFERDALRISAAGITRGCNPPANDRFCPDDAVTRGEMAALFSRALGLTATTGATDFRDTDDSIFERDIARIAAADITRGCNPPANDEFCPDDDVTREQMAAFFRRALDQPLDLTVAHVNDHHSHLAPNSATLVLDGQDTDASTGGFPRVVTKIDAIDRANEHVLKVHAGDAITGTLFYSLFEGEADAAMMNEVCFDVFALGNHEFDDGDAGLANFLDFLNAADCGTETLAANVVPAAGTPLADGYLQPFTIRRYRGQQVGIIGIDIANKTRNSSSPLDSTQFLDEVETTQRFVDVLEARGVDKIIAVTHYQYGNDQALAAAVDGVDVIVGGDSHSLLGDYGQYGLGPEGAYPTVATDADGDTVCIVQAWQYADVVGQLDVSFDRDGDVASCGGNPTLLLGDDFSREIDDEDVALTGADRAAVEAEIAGTPLLEVVAPDAAAQSILDMFSEQVEELEQEVIGEVASALCLERIPGQDFRVTPACPSGYGEDNGGDAQQTVADAFLARSFEADLSIQNAGGVREQVDAGDYTIADAFELLPFSNTLVNLDMTGQEVVDVLNEALDFALLPDGSTGAYPYGSQIRWTTNFDTGAIVDVEVDPDGDGTYEPIDTAATYTVVTNDFIAGGQDGYDTFGEVTDDGRVTDTFIDYAQAFIDWVEQDVGGTVTPPEAYSTNQIIGSYSP